MSSDTHGVSLRDARSEGPAPRFRGARPRLPAAVLPAALLLSLLLPGCKTGAGGARPAEAFTVAEWSDLGIQTLAFVEIASTVGDETARKAAEQVVEDGLRAGQERFVVLTGPQARSRAGSNSAGDLFEKVARVWRNSHVTDPFLVQELSGKLGVDGLVFADLGEWKEEQVDWTSEGNSSTTVNLGLSIYSGKTGQLAWNAEKTLRKESIKYTPGQAGSGVYTTPSGASRAERPSSLTPKPPRAEDVAGEVMQTLIAAFPPRPRSG
jgi:hypothetical protein